MRSVRGRDGIVGRGARGCGIVPGLHLSFQFRGVRRGGGEAGDLFRRRFAGWRLLLFDGIPLGDSWGGTFRPMVLHLMA